MSYTINNPFDDYKRQMKEMQERAKEQIEKLNQESIWKDGEAPMDYARRIENNLNSVVPMLDKISNTSIEQVESIKSIADSAMQQAKSAKIIADRAELEIKRLSDTSLSAKIKAGRSFWLAFASFGFSILINLDEIINVAKWIKSCLYSILGLG